MRETGGVDAIARLLRPRSIAVVGASTARNKLAGQIIPSLQAAGYDGPIYPVNPRYGEVAGLACYPSLAAVPGPVDHCVIIVGRERVADVLADCRRLSVPTGSIFTSGYAEVDEGGRRAEAALRELSGGMTFLGPNCMGFANLADRVIATTSAVFRHESRPGGVALVSQSGGLAYATLCYCASQIGLRFSYVVNTGNAAGFSFADFTEFVFADPRSRVMLAVVEGEAIVRDVVEVVRRRGLGKPIVLLKLGRGPTGIRMARSHTGSDAGDYATVREAAEGAGIVCVDDFDEALAVSDLIERGFTARQADGLAAISISGGNITLFADLVDGQGLPFATLSAATEGGLREVLPEYISVHNPIDITALGYEEPELHRRVLEVLVKDPAVTTVVPVITSAEDYRPVCRLLAEVRTETGCSMIVLWAGGSYESESPRLLAEAGIPVFKTGNSLVRALARLRASGVGRQLTDRRP